MLLNEKITPVSKMLVQIHDSSIQVGGCFTVHDRLHKNTTGNVIMTIGKERMMEMIATKPKTICSLALKKKDQGVPKANPWIKYFRNK